MAFAYTGDGSLDYFPCSYGKSKLLFRGPLGNLDQSFCAILGGTEVYGKFVARPFSMLVAEKTGRQILNLGCMNAGPDVYLNDPEVLRIVGRADLTVVQVMGAQNLSNRFYAVHPRRNDRFLRATSWLRSIYREVDFTDFHFTRHMLQSLHEVSEERFALVAAELRDSWVSRMIELLSQVRGKTLLLWMAGHKPPKAGEGLDLSHDPLMIEDWMIEKVRRHADAYLEVVTSNGAHDEKLESMYFAPLERPAAEGVPGPLVHREVADAVSDAIGALI